MGPAGSCVGALVVVVVVIVLQFLTTNVAAYEDPNSVLCHSNPCQNNGTCVNMLRPGSDRSLSVCNDGSCYKFITEKRTWEEATIQCSRMGASLVSIETDSESVFLKNAIKVNYLHKTSNNPENPGGFWSSGNDLSIEGRWVWAATDVPVSVARNPLQGAAGIQRCLLLYTDLGRVSWPQWKTAPCSMRLHFACEMSVEALYQERTSYCLCSDGYSGEFCEHTSDLQTEYVCDNDALDLRCEGGQRLTVVHASFHLAMPANTRCPHPTGVPPTGNCILPSTLSTLLHQVLQPRCDGQERCTVNVTEDVLSKYDQCPSNRKYAQVEYSCTDTYTVHAEACETSVADLTCQKPLRLPFIRVEVAVYGRLRPSSGCRGQTAEPAKVCRAISTLDVAASRCNGYSVCNITASHELFGDPCEGVYKYLDIRYQCVANLTDAIASYPLTHGIATLSPPVFCQTVNRSGLLWRTTKEGQTDWQRCPDGQTGLASWYCDSRHPVRWSTSGPDMSQCVSLWITDIYEQIRTGSVSANNIAEIALQNTAADGTIKSSDLQKTVALMDDLVQLQAVQLQRLGEQEKEAEIQMFGKTLLEFGSNVLDTSKQSTWASVASDNAASRAPSTEVSPTFVTENLEKTGFLIAQNFYKNRTSVTINSDNILMTVEALAPSDAGQPVYFQDSRKTEDGADAVLHAIVLPPSATRTKGPSPGGDPVKVVFLVYETLGEYLTDVAIEGLPQPTRPSNGSDYDSGNGTQEAPLPLLNSAVVSASAKKSGRDVETFDGKEEVLLTIKHTTTNITGDVSCVFWNSSKSLGKNGAWSDKGCRLVSSNQTYSICACNHLTNFAILMDVTGAHTGISKIHEQILTGLTFIGCTLSIICLAMSLFAFTFFRNIWSLRVTIHRNLCLMLLVANTLFIVGVDKTQIKVYDQLITLTTNGKRKLYTTILCSVIAALLHYCFLTAFVWMSLEAVQFYIMLVHVFSTHSRHWPYYLAGYGIPAIVVGVSAGINHSGYGTDKYCWLSTDDYFIWSFVGPVAGIIVVNVVLLVVSLRKAYASRSSVSQNMTKNDIRPWIKGAMTLLFLLGITWGVGFFFLSVDSVVVAYIFTILNSLQGLFIFVFYCLGNERVNCELRKFVSRQKWLPACIRDRYGKRISSSNSMSNRTVTSTHQISRPEVYQKRGSFDCSAMTKLNEATCVESPACESHTNPAIDVTLVEDSEDAPAGTEALSAADTGSPNTAGGMTNPENATQEGSSWLHNNSINNIVADNKNLPGAAGQYPKVDYE